MEPADPLRRDDPAVSKESGGGTEGIGGLDRVAELVQQPQARTTRATGIRLRVEAAVQRRVVLAPAIGAHPEGRHGGRRAVVRHVAGDGEARSAVGAVRERIPVAAVCRIEDLGEAVHARRQVGGDRDAAIAVLPALDDDESLGRLRGNPGPLEVADARGRRRARAEAREKAVEGLVGPERLDRDALRAVVDASGDSSLFRETVHPRAEPDSLDDPAHGDAHPLRVHRRSPTERM
jgi:hypothetical protein